MMVLTLIAMFAFAVFLVIYHHVLYPVMLALFAKQRNTPLREISTRHYVQSGEDANMRRFSIVIPAYNEAAYIADKVRNLGCLDYPNDRFELILLCDGCQDQTYQLATEALAELGLEELDYQVINFDVNRGKVAVLKDGVRRAKYEHLVFSDVSALLPVNALLMLDSNFQDSTVGAVSGGYCFANKGSLGEQKYWQYQRQVRERESSVGSVIGAHGAFYAVRSDCFEDIPANTINDDFLIPMKVVKQGYRVLYDSRVAAIELEQVELAQDMQRRLRIAAGNFQQMLMLVPLMNPKYRWNAVNFVSGKVLRALMPFILLFILLSNLVITALLPVGLSTAAHGGIEQLALWSWFFQMTLSAQVLLYAGVSLLNVSRKVPASGLVKIMCYMVNGYWVALIGSTKYMLGLQAKVWSKISD
ncbi:glycosyltransferase family 2 protein [Thalassotalea euphylliae]|uniref:Glycosyltransferase family 2 protein n=1 Tax=Thalassotalea euphylliae TaxID=1655234 RepID=A0A3E0TUF6_9GAMM|nr:glycosyltransferase family 2 protein [Thalassotalea euphylliae]REL28023.1 glycosyltransferase family 2 protein [Thalassotalea euphylliae]